MERSEVSEQAAGIAEASIDGVYEQLGNRAVSSEIYHMADLDLTGYGKKRSRLRGVTTRALLTHPGITVIEGSFPNPGEVMVGRMAWRRLGVPEEALVPGTDPCGLMMSNCACPECLRIRAPSPNPRYGWT